MSGLLILVGAPLGNPADASQRLKTTLADVDIVAAEDTRRLTRLVRELGVEVTARVVSYFEGNEERRTPELVEALLGGARVAVITDGGMPSVSDPGYRLVRAAIDASVPVSVAPGPSAVTTALALSGLPSDRFCFEGFPPRKPAERRTLLRQLADERRTLVFFEAPHRVAGTVADLAAVFGPDRPAALCRELTKTFEEVRRLPLAALVESVAADPPRGEITLVVAGAPPSVPARPGDAQLRDEVAGGQRDGLSRRDAITRVAEDHGLPRREVYNLVVGGP